MPSTKTLARSVGEAQAGHCILNLNLSSPRRGSVERKNCRTREKAQVRGRDLSAGVVRHADHGSNRPSRVELSILARSRASISVAAKSRFCIAARYEPAKQGSVCLSADRHVLPLDPWRPSAGGRLEQHVSNSRWGWVRNDDCPRRDWLCVCVIEPRTAAQVAR